MRNATFLLCLALLLSMSASAQEFLGDVLSGKLVDPEVGAYAWYDLHDASTDKRFFLRQAIVGEERVKWKKGYWIETEIQPEVGFPIIYRMLLTGPASDIENIHRLIVKEGTRPAQEIKLDADSEAFGDDSEDKKPERKLIGEETIQLPDREIKAEHFELGEGDAKTELWVNEEVKPMGIVKMTSPKGELTLRRFGEGGPDSHSALEQGGGTTPPEDDVRVRVEPGPSRNFTGRKEAE